MGRPLIRVAPKESRTYKGVTYASNTEMRRAMFLDDLKAADAPRVVDYWLRQVPVQLGTDPATIYRVDFLVFWNNGAVHFEDVKAWYRKKNTWGKTRSFARTESLWRRYGPAPLRIMVFRGGQWTCAEEIPGRQQAGGE